MSRIAKISLISNVGLEKIPPQIDAMIAHLQQKIEQVLPDKPDLILLPEACDRCVSLSDKEQNAWYKKRGNVIRDFLSQIAREHRCYIAYSAIRYLPQEEKQQFRNSIQILGRDGIVVGTYDKNHLVPHEFDDRDIAYGTEAEVFQLDFGKVACVICFDLNFNSLLERYAAQGPDLILFSSFYHGGIKQMEWASRCQAYFAGAIDRNQSRVLNAFGNEIASTTNYQDFVTTTLNFDTIIVHLDENQDKIRAAKKKFGPALTVFDPGQYGCVMLTYEDTDRTVLDVVHEFDILIFYAYMKSCLDHRKANIL